eukprot:CAMPEP_0184371758 /NCGR_PEP_ID=MMETSP1089-20130417/163577_1 /TAXON_ID=38269 ORGANISM="Gloeochaete wittrockiana, Strain SAG46.84" /NCGR_SAMPLE_ID=MMETSP1089 /ASSEMBLY_ACC=CAM_ASM_000445 /LENGTH=240 /DNA_ID=CAMNT_0026714547 /DNA_START=1152 /DNA_END=1874 /DNA_ORIENTATION=+
MPSLNSNLPSLSSSILPQSLAQSISTDHVDPDIFSLIGSSDPDQPITDSALDIPSLQKSRSTSVGLSLTYESLQPYFTTSLASAAKQLGIGVTTLKSRCRLLGIKKWPYAQMLKERDIPAEAILPHVGQSERRAARIVGSSLEVFRRACKTHGITAWAAKVSGGLPTVLPNGEPATTSENRTPTNGEPATDSGLSIIGAASSPSDDKDTPDSSSLWTLEPSDEEATDSPATASLDHLIGP